MTDRAEAIHRAVEALDFLPIGLNVVAARPPLDADGLEAMYAAVALHKLLRHYRGRSEAAAAWQAHEAFIALEKEHPHGPELKEPLRRYREALTAALVELIASDEASEFDELLSWYKQDLKRIDG